MSSVLNLEELVDYKGGALLTTCFSVPLVAPYSFSRVWERVKEQFHKKLG